jgi:transcriptional regulator with XRE-family HTH domain
MTVRAIVAKNLRKLRNAQGVSQEELAARADVDRNYVGKLEREENSATIDMLEKLAVALGVEVRAFFDPDGGS